MPTIPNPTCFGGLKFGGDDGILMLYYGIRGCGMKLLSFGEVLWDIYPDKKCLGGAPLNFAAHFVKAGGEADIITAVGNDSLGAETLEGIRRLGVGTGCVAVVNAPTGRCLVTLDENSVPTYDLLSGVAYDMIPPPKDCGDFDVMYFGTLALRSRDNLSTVRRLLERCGGKTVFVDMNIRPPFYTSETVRFALSNADVVKLSDEELPTVFETVFGRECPAAEDAAARLADEFGGCKLMIVTRGGDGAFAYDCRGKEFYRCGAVKAEVVSTVGAGDSFGAVFLHSYLSGRGVADCLAAASIAAARVVACAEAVPQ